MDKTLKVASREYLEQIPAVTVTFVQVAFVQVTFVLATFVHIRNNSAVIDPIFFQTLEVCWKGQAKFKARSRQGQGKVKANLRQGQGKVKARSRKGHGKVKAR